MDGFTSSESADPKNKFILVVDDDNGIRALLEELISGEGYPVESASNAEEALRKVKQRTPNLVITDLMMPGSGGYGLLKELQNDETSQIPIIVMTASVMDPSTEQMLRDEINVVEFIPKPIQTAMFREALHRLLKTPSKKRPAG